MEKGMERASEDRHPKRHDPGSPNAASHALETLPFRLQHGEIIIRELKPQFFGFMVTRSFGSYVALLLFSIISIALVVVLHAQLASYLVWVLLLPFFLFLLVMVIALKPLVQYGKSWYWITNHRVIGKRGFLGYSINSVPLENVADVVLTRTLLDRLLGLSSLIVVSMGNAPVSDSSTEDEKAESPNFFPALTQETARELQRVLFNLRDELKKQDQVPKSVSTVTWLPQHAMELLAPLIPKLALAPAPKIAPKRRRTRAPLDKPRESSLNSKSTKSKHGNMNLRV